MVDINVEHHDCKIQARGDSREDAEILEKRLIKLLDNYEINSRGTLVAYHGTIYSRSIPPVVHIHAELPSKIWRVRPLYSNSSLCGFKGLNLRSQELTLQIRDIEYCIRLG